MAATKLSNQVCAWDGCTNKTPFRRDGVTPLKYCKVPQRTVTYTADDGSTIEKVVTHKTMAFERFKSEVWGKDTEREALDAEYQAALDMANQAADEAAAGANKLSPPSQQRILFGPYNHKFSRWLERSGIATKAPGGVEVLLPAVEGSRERAEAILATLRPLTTSGEKLERLALKVK